MTSTAVMGIAARRSYPSHAEATFALQTVDAVLRGSAGPMQRPHRINALLRLRAHERHMAVEVVNAFVA